MPSPWFDKEILPDIKKGYAPRACITAYSAENSARGVIKDNFSISYSITVKTQYAQNFGHCTRFGKIKSINSDKSGTIKTRAEQLLRFGIDIFATA